MTAIPSTAALRLGERVRDARNARGWSQEALGRYIGLPAQRIGRIEAGQGYVPIEVIELLAAAFDVPPAVLTGWATPSGGLASALMGLPGPRPSSPLAPRTAPAQDTPAAATLRDAIVSAAAVHR